MKIAHPRYYTTHLVEHYNCQTISFYALEFGIQKWFTNHLWFTNTLTLGLKQELVLIFSIKIFMRNGNFMLF